MPRTISIPSGTTLSGLAKQYGTTTNELMSLNPTIKDPNKIFAGATLNLPELAGTLETGGEKEKTLPTQPVDKLSMFGDVLKMVTNRAAKESIAKGGEAFPEGMLKPEQVSGGSFADVLNLTAQQKTRGIADIYKSTVKMIEDSRTRANDQLQMLVTTGGITKLDDGTLQRLADMTDFEFDYLKGIQTAKQQEQATTTKMTDLDRVNDLNKFLSDKVGEDTKISAKSYIDAYKRWISLNGIVQDFRYAYPVEEWVGEHEFENLPSEWRPKAGPTVQDIKTLSVEDQVTIKRLQEMINNRDKTYEEVASDFPDFAIYLNPEN